jgi:hypothetical protein
MNRSYDVSGPLGGSEVQEDQNRRMEPLLRLSEIVGHPTLAHGWPALNSGTARAIVELRFWGVGKERRCCSLLRVSWQP